MTLDGLPGTPGLYRDSAQRTGDGRASRRRRCLGRLRGGPLLLAGAALACLTACGGGPEIAEGPYTGPALQAETVRGGWEIEFQTPTPGWQWTIERSQESFGRELVYMTGREPDPLFRYPEGAVTQRVRTAAPSFRSLDLYVALAEFDRAPGDEPYVRALRAETTESAESGGSAQP